MKSVFIFSVLQIMPATFRCMTFQTLANIFHHNFRHLPNIGDVIVWKILENIEKFQPQIFESDIPKFNSDQTYLMLTRSDLGRLRVFYWNGSTASLVAKQTAAKYALHQYSLLNDYFNYKMTVSIHREEEFVESKFFDNTVNFVDQTKEPEIATFHEYVEEQLPYKFPNLFIVRGSSTTRVKAVPVGIQWLINDACIILETGYNVEELNQVTTYCGPNANGTTVLSTVKAGKIMTKIYNEQVEKQPIEKHDPMFKAVIEVLENRDYCRSHEVDDSNDHLNDVETFVADRNRYLSFYRIFQNEMTKIEPRPKVSFSSYYHHIEMFNHNGCYLLDSASVAGLFLQMNPDTSLEVKLLGLELAEEYLHIKYSVALKPQRMRITEIHELALMPISLSINLSNFLTIEELERQVDNDGNDV